MCVHKMCRGVQGRPSIKQVEIAQQPQECMGIGILNGGKKGKDNE